MNDLSLGILGGLGPLASAELLKTIYEVNLKILEQQSPKCILYSDPRFPDRTDAISSGLDRSIVNPLIESLERLHRLGVTKIVIACITIHYFLPQVPIQLREKVISLIELIIQEVLKAQKTGLLLCSNGARKAEIFPKHLDWNSIKNYIIMPDEYEQNILQNHIYQLKMNDGFKDTIQFLDALASKYKIDMFIAGCTELHLVKKYLMASEPLGLQFDIIDPCMILAENLSQLMVAKNTISQK